MAFPRSVVSLRHIMLLCGAGLTLLTVLLASQGIPGWLIPAGFALVTSAGLFGEFAPAVVQLKGDPKTSGVAIMLADGSEATIPRSALETARVHHSSGEGGSSTKYQVTLWKADGGMVTICKVGTHRARAEELCEAINALLNAVPPRVEEEEALVEAARKRLTEAPAIELVAQQSARRGYRASAAMQLQVSWSAAPPTRSIMMVLVVFGGPLIALGGMLGAPPASAVAVLVALLLLSVLRHARLRRLTQMVCIDQDHLSLSKQGGKAADKRDFPVATIEAVDVDLSGSLVLRIDGANADGLMAVLRQRVPVDVGALSLSQRLDLETVLGAEVAQRSGRKLGRL